MICRSGVGVGALTTIPFNKGLGYVPLAKQWRWGELVGSGKWRLSGTKKNLCFASHCRTTSGNKPVWPWGTVTCLYSTSWAC